jgi:hypothetical protein
MTMIQNIWTNLPAVAWSLERDSLALIASMTGLWWLAFILAEMRLRPAR